MTDQTTQPERDAREENFKRLIVFLIALVTVFATIITYLQSDAGARDDRANRDSKRYALEALGRKVSGDSQVNFDYNAAYQSYYEYETLANAAEARGDTAAAERYEILRDRMVELSPLLKAPYFNPETGEIDTAKYETDTYLTDITALTERFTVASAVKDAWDVKSNTYIVHLTLLAVALFLFGLAGTLNSPYTRWIFTISGFGATAVAMVWAASVFLTPVPDLRDKPGAIENYAKGVSLAYQGLSQEALAAFDEALKVEPEYVSALTDRASELYGTGEYAAAAEGFEKALAAGETRSWVNGLLASSYYRLGRFEDARRVLTAAKNSGNIDLWMEFDLAVNLLASGQIDAAKAEYRRITDSVIAGVAAAQTTTDAPPSSLWSGLEDAASELDLLSITISEKSGVPPFDKIVSPEAVQPVADELSAELSSLAMALENTGKPPQGTLTAKLGDLEFGTPVVSEQGEMTDIEAAESFPAETKAVALSFDFEGIKDGQSVIFKVYLDGEEDPTWRYDFDWDDGETGTFQEIISPTYSSAYVVPPGSYLVEVYVDYRLAQYGGFEVKE